MCTNFIWKFLSYRWIFGFHNGGGVFFCIFANIHLFIARRSAATLDLNRCNDTSVPKSQQRYNPNIFRGMIIETSLALIITKILFIRFFSVGLPGDDQLFHTIVYVEQIGGLLSFVFLPFLYILLTPSVRKHVSTIFNVRMTSVTPEVH